MGKQIEEYSPVATEKKWIESWERDGVYAFKDDGNPKKLYILDMFPYPSGSGLHVGHLKGYLATDILTRFYRMKGYLVFHPMGWDAFGLPAEQYAIATGNSPAEFTRKNIDNFKSQLKRLMLTYDFAYEVDTSSPEYYAHTQWIFSEMYQRGLAKLVDTQVNWCEELNTVLSDEEIVVDEKNCLFSERGNYPVQVKTMKQWVLKITKYADELLGDIPLLEWPENVKKIQKDWIGASSKYEYPFRFGSEVYPLYLKRASSIRKLKGIGIHQFSRLSKILGVNQNNTGDREIVHGVELLNMVDYSRVSVYYLWNIDFRADELLPLFDGSEDDFYDEEIEKYYLSRERIPVSKRVYKLKDWVFSRQRFWGEPIPILFDKDGNSSLDFDLPVVLPNRVDYKTQRNAQSPLANDVEWVNVVKNGVSYRRETSTMPNWAGSSWYFMAYLLKKSDNTYHRLDSPEAKQILDRWLPVDIYVGGQEHAAMHLLYARFWHKFLRKIGVVNSPEPFKTLLNQGMVLGSDGTKMSKSKGNYVSIDEIIDKYGADTLRVYEAFSGPTQLSFRWEDEGIRGSHKWLHRVNIFFQTLDSLERVSEEDSIVSGIENKLIGNVESAIPNLKVNLGISEMMIFLNEIQKIGKYHDKALNSFVQILGLYAPALAEEIWRVRLGREDYLFKSQWPILNGIKEGPEVDFKVFVNGKFKFNIALNKDDLVESGNYLRGRMEEKLETKDLEVKGVMMDKRIILVEIPGSAQ